MSAMLVVEGKDYKWLLDFLERMEIDADATLTEDDLDAISGVIQRVSCCDRCEGVWNARALEDAGYEKKGIERENK